MRTMIGLAMVVLLTNSGCYFALQSTVPVTTGSGVTKKETRELPGFTGVDVSSTFEATVTIGPKPSVTLEVDDNLLELVKTDVRDGRLYVEYVKGQNIRTSKTQKVSIVVPTLESVRAHGAAKVLATAGGANAPKIEAEGASRIEWKDLDSDSIDLDVSGASQATLQGRAKRLKLSVSGASKVSAGQATMETASVKIDGASSAELTVTDSVQGQLSGASSLKVHGDPKHREVKTSGASSVSY